MLLVFKGLFQLLLSLILFLVDASNIQWKMVKAYDSVFIHWAFMGRLQTTYFSISVFIPNQY